jgi:hopanoid biosynthesis associated RND transporter like protein HpnN
MVAYSSMIGAVVRLVGASRRYAVAVAALALLATAAAGFYVSRRIAIDTDTSNLISPDLPWRRAAAELDKAFPQNIDLLAIVIDGDTPDQTEDAASALAARFAANRGLFQDVREPAASTFFRKNGMLFLSLGEVQTFADSMITAQPMLGALASDPSPRGVFNALDLFSQGVIRGQITASALDKPFGAVAGAVDAALDGRYAPLSWQRLLSDRRPGPREMRRIILARPALNYGDVEPGRRAIEEVHAAARAGGFVPENGVRVRVTGPVALSDDQLSALSDGVGVAAGLSFGLMVLWLALAMRSFRAVAAILVTLAVGLVACACFAVAVVGPFNPISVAFAPLFIGIAIDFGIQFSVRYAAERHGCDEEQGTPGGGAPAGPKLGESLSEALRRTAAGVGTPLVVAGAATAAGFLSLFPTEYRGVSDLGLIAGAGMLIALLLNLTLLPALLALFRSGGFREAGGFARAAPLDLLLVRRRRWIFAACGLLAAASALALAGLRFDFDPINLENPDSESAKTLFDLMKDPETTPYTLEVLAASAKDASELASRLGRLREVSQAIWLGSFVPGDQPAKLEIIEDARGLLEPAWSSPPAGDTAGVADIVAAAGRCAADIRRVAAGGVAPAARLAAALERVVSRGAAAVPALEANLSRGAVHRLEDVRLALQAAPVSLETIPPDVRRDWVAADGRYRVEVFPRGDARNHEVLQSFVAAVAREAPRATGMPVQIQESARTVIRAFETAGLLAVGAITLLLFVVLRRPRDILAVLVPLLLAGLLTLATSVLAGMPLNFANIVTLPLLLGIGVAFDIYFVLRWRSGEAGLLQSPTARGVVFSALTTGTAFGSLMLSKSPGMADMGKLLSLGLFYTLVCTLFFLPAFLGAPPVLPEEGNVK